MSPSKHSPPRTLVAVLNWGLGHATRCIPLIQELLSQGHEVLLASDGRAGLLLCKEFPQLPYFELPPYNVYYRTSNMFWNIAWQLPKIARAIYREHRAINRLIRQERIDFLISDNRYGCWSKAVRSIFMTHQINIRIPFGPLQRLVAWCNRRAIALFDELWIPDVAECPGLGGALSHGNLPSKTVYLGPLSRFEPMELSIQYDLIVVLSGPEPQRTYFEEKVLEQALNCSLQILVVQGRTEREERRRLNERLELVSYLTATELNRAICQSRLVISRPGYSTILDLVALGKPAVLVPTPGQTEQEYLAEELERAALFHCVAQSVFDLEKAVARSAAYPGFGREWQAKKSLRQAIERLAAG
ncbi:MAG: glycosyltransferase [Bacteroidota bacterium]